MITKPCCQVQHKPQPRLAGLAVWSQEMCQHLQTSRSTSGRLVCWCWQLSKQLLSWARCQAPSSGVQASKQPQYKLDIFWKGNFATLGTPQPKLVVFILDVFCCDFFPLTSTISYILVSQLLGGVYGFYCHNKLYSQEEPYNWKLLYTKGYHSSYERQSSVLTYTSHLVLVPSLTTFQLDFQLFSFLYCQAHKALAKLGWVALFPVYQASQPPPHPQEQQNLANQVNKAEYSS